MTRRSSGSRAASRAPPRYHIGVAKRRLGDEVIAMLRKSNLLPNTSESGLRNDPILHLACESIVAALVVLSGTFAFAQSQKSQPHREAAGGGSVARGKYIVEGVARCGDCHTPSGTDGRLDRAHW